MCIGSLIDWLTGLNNSRSHLIKVLVYVKATRETTELNGSYVEGSTKEKKGNH